MVTIYMLTVAGTEFTYVGATRNARRRKSSHLCALRRGYHPNKALQGLVELHGIEAFSFTPLESCGQWDAQRREQYWIDEQRKICTVLNVMPATLANFIMGAGKKRVVIGHRVINRTTGKIYPSQSEAARAHGVTNATIASAVRNPNRTAAGYFWAPYVDGAEKSAKKSAQKSAADAAAVRKEAAQRGPKMAAKFATPILNKTTGVVYPSQRAAARAYGMTHANIAQVLRGQCKTAAGCEWEYHGEPVIRRDRPIKRELPKRFCKKSKFATPKPITQISTR